MYTFLCEESPKVTTPFFHRSKIVVQEMYGLVHISDFEYIKCGKVQNIPICFTVISLVNQTLTCGLIAMGRFKFMVQVHGQQFFLIKWYQ